MRAAKEFQNGNKVKQLRPGPNGHKFRGASSGASRKNRTWETRRLARSIRDVAVASRRGFVAEARPRCGSGDRLIWTQPSARQAQLFGQTTWRICSLKIAAEEMTRGMRQRGIVALHDSERASQRRGYSRLTRVRKARFLIIIRNMVWCVPYQLFSSCHTNRSKTME